MSDVDVSEAVQRARDQQRDALDSDPDLEAGAEQVEQAVEEIGEIGEPDDAVDPFGWLMESPDGSIFDTDVRELWNPDEGGVNRLLLLAEDLAGTDGMPRIGHLLIAVAEIARQMQDDDGDDAGNGGDWT